MTKRPSFTTPPPGGETELLALLEQARSERGSYPSAICMSPMRRMALPPEHWYHFPIGAGEVEITSSPDQEGLTPHWPEEEIDAQREEEEEEERRPVCD